VAEDELAKLNAIFSKARHAQKFPLTTEWCFKPGEGSKIALEVKDSELNSVILDLIRQGVDKNGDIADTLQPEANYRLVKLTPSKSLWNRSSTP
jgi:hypothetical protein